MTPQLDETIYFAFNTNNASGAATPADSTPTVEVLENTTSTPIITPTPSLISGFTATYIVTVACTTANGFEVGKTYNAVVTATVSGTTAEKTISTFQVRSDTISGPSSVTLTFEDSNNDPVPLVRFTVVGQASGQADTDGEAAFGLLDGTYTVTAAPTNGVYFPNHQLVVSGTTTLTIEGTSPAVVPPVNPDLSLVYGDLVDLSGNPVVGAQVIFTLVNDGPAMDGGILQQLPPKIATTDSDGHFEIELTKTSAMTPTGCLYKIEIPNFKFTQRTSITGASFDVGTLIT